MPSRVSVAMFAQNYAPEPSGNAPYVTALAEGLQAGGDFDVRVVTSHPYYPEWRIQDGYGQWSTREQRNGVDVRRKRHFVPAHPTSLKRLVSELSFGVRSVFTSWGSPDIVVLVSPSMFACALTLARARLLHPKTPVVTWIQDLYSLGVVETGANGATARLVRAVEGALVRKSTRVTVIHDRFKASITTLLGIDPTRVDVIRNWTHITPLDQRQRVTARQAMGWSDAEVVALHTGNMGLKQGLETVVRAAQAADAQSAPVRFVLLGGGNQRQQLREMGKGVERLDFIDSLPDDEYAMALVGADVLVVNELPGVSGMAVPSKLTSYFAAGRPVVAATDPDGVTSEEVLAAGAGVCVPAGDPAALLDAVIAVGNDPELSTALGEAGVRYYERLLSPRSALSAFGDSLAALVRQRRR